MLKKLSQLKKIFKLPQIFEYTQKKFVSADGLGRGTSILGEVRNVEISGVTQQLLCSKSHDFLAFFAPAHPK